MELIITLNIQSNLTLRTFLVTPILVLILTVLKANLAKLVIGDLVLKAKLVLILTVLKVRSDCTLNFA